MFPKKNFFLFIFFVIVFVFVFLIPIKSVFAKVNYTIKVEAAYPDKPNGVLHLNFYQDKGAASYPIIKTFDVVLKDGVGEIYLGHLEENTQYMLASDYLNDNFADNVEYEFTTGTEDKEFIDIEHTYWIDYTGSDAAPETYVDYTTPATETTEDASTDSPGSGGSSEFSSTMTSPDLPEYGLPSWAAIGKRIMDVLGWIAGVVFVGVILVGAVMYIVAGGNEEKAETAKKAIYAAIIGIVIVALAWTIVTFIAGEFSSTPTSSTGSPAATNTPANTETP